MKVELADYDSSWPAAFGAEAARITGALGAHALRIEHVGSTSVPGLAAKPVIDIQVSVEAVTPLDGYAEALVGLGYVHISLPDPGDDVYPFFMRPPSWPSSHHVHLCELGGLEERRHLAFRDWLRAHAEDRQAYEDLKNGLAAAVDENDPASVFAYSSGKTDFVRAIEARAMG
jgi:GrpB-like predicted nucleotidyltransferase (UPF0157 family)